MYEKTVNGFWLLDELWRRDGRNYRYLVGWGRGIAGYYYRVLDGLSV